MRSVHFLVPSRQGLVLAVSACLAVFGFLACEELKLNPGDDQAGIDTPVATPTAPPDPTRRRPASVDSPTTANPTSTTVLGEPTPDIELNPTDTEAISFDQIRRLAEAGAKEAGDTEPDLSRSPETAGVTALTSATPRSGGRERSFEIDVDQLLNPPESAPLEVDVLSFRCKDIWYDGEAVNIGTRDAVLLVLSMWQQDSDATVTLVHAFKCEDGETVDLQLKPFFTSSDASVPVSVSGYIQVAHPQELQNLEQAIATAAEAQATVACTPPSVGALICAAAKPFIDEFVSKLFDLIIPLLTELSECYSITRGINESLLPEELHNMNVEMEPTMLWHTNGTKCKFGHAGGKFNYELYGDARLERSLPDLDALPRR